MGGHVIVGHGRSLYREGIAVSLIMKLPNMTEGRIVEQRVDSIDVVPTVLDAVDIPGPSQVRNTLRGRCLTFLTSGERSDRRNDAHYSVSELITNRYGPYAMRSIENAHSKLVETYQYHRDRSFAPPSRQLLFHGDDGGESLVRRPASKTERELGQELQVWANGLSAVKGRQRERSVNREEELRERLKALGCLD